MGPVTKRAVARAVLFLALVMLLVGPGCLVIIPADGCVPKVEICPPVVVPCTPVPPAIVVPLCVTPTPVPVCPEVAPSPTCPTAAAAARTPMIVTATPAPKAPTCPTVHGP